MPHQKGYNAGMGHHGAAEMDAWLLDGGVVVAASDRAARAIEAAYHRARRAESRTAWTAPKVIPWLSFTRNEWSRRATGDCFVLNALQEQALWSGIVGAGGHAAAMLQESRRRLGALAMEAHALLCSYSPRLLDARTHNGWQQDSAAFSEWLAAFDESCNEINVLSSDRVNLELIPLLNQDQTPRPPLLLAGFDRLLPVQRDVLDAWGTWRHSNGGDRANSIRFYSAADEPSEFAACATWCRKRLAADPNARLLILTLNAAKRRGAIERAFLEHCGPDSQPQFEFTLGVPLGGVGVARSALLLLRWLDGTLEERELDWLIFSGYSAKDSTETSALQACMRSVRRRNLQRVRWTLAQFLHHAAASAVLAHWSERMIAAQRRLQPAVKRSSNALEWANLMPHLLSEIGWAREASSPEFQAARRFQQVAETCASLGFDGSRMPWRDFLAELDRTAAETLFSPESHDAPILIAGPAESAGLSADAIWFIGANEDAWPGRGNIHPLLPIEVQRAARMPHASPQLDWELANTITTRILRSAPEVIFSRAHQVDGVETRASRLVTQVAGEPVPLPAEIASTPPQPVFAVEFEDLSRIPLHSAQTEKASGEPPPNTHETEVRGGSHVLTAQSQCAFKAFATSRLGAQGWDPAEAGLTASLRGKLLHSALHAVWHGTPDGVRTLEQLLNVPDRQAFVAGHVRTVLANELPNAVREQVPPRYLELEQVRLSRVITEWLEYESARLPFSVVHTEFDTAIMIEGLKLNVRLDRIDELNDGSLLVIDYKTGQVSPASWDLPRPDDVQLPLYAGFALPPGSELGGLVFAKVRMGEVCFSGRVCDPDATLGTQLSNRTSLNRNKFAAEQILGWREAIQQLAIDYLRGRADVNPRDPIETCKRCVLQALCRVRERRAGAEEEVEESADE